MKNKNYMEVKERLLNNPNFKNVIENIYNFWKDEDEKTLFEIRHISDQRCEILDSYKTDHYKHVDYSSIWYIQGGI